MNNPTICKRNISALRYGDRESHDSLTVYTARHTYLISDRYPTTISAVRLQFPFHRIHTTLRMCQKHLCSCYALRPPLPATPPHPHTTNPRDSQMPHPLSDHPIYLLHTTLYPSESNPPSTSPVFPPQTFTPLRPALSGPAQDRALGAQRNPGAILFRLGILCSYV
jgi:hypothetical protein